MAGEKFHIDFKGDMKDIDDFTKSKISETLTRFLEKFSRETEESFLRLQFKKHKEQFRKKQLYLCRMNLDFHLGRFHSEEKGWGAEQSVVKTLDELKKQILKKRDRLEDIKRHKASEFKK